MITKKLLVRIILIATIALSPLMLFRATPVFAEESSSDYVETTFFGNLKSDDKGCGVYTILNDVVDILSIGIGILGVIGISIVGVQYLTSGGNEQQATKAKRRLGEIVLGLLAYAIFFTFSQWLLPGARLNTSATCVRISDEQLARLKEAEKLAKEEARIKAQNENKGSSSKYSKSNNERSIKQSSNGAEAIAKAAIFLSLPKGSKYSHNYSNKKYKSWSELTKTKPSRAFMEAFDELYPNHWDFSFPANIGADCGKFVKIVLKYAQVHYGIQDIPAWGKGFVNKFSKSKHWKKVTRSQDIQPGDICISSDHQKIYIGNKRVAEAGNHSKRFGHIHGGSEGNCKGYTVYHYVD